MTGYLKKTILQNIYTYTHTHTHKHIYIYIYIYTHTHFSKIKSLQPKSNKRIGQTATYGLRVMGNGTNNHASLKDKEHWKGTFSSYFNPRLSSSQTAATNCQFTLGTTVANGGGGGAQVRSTHKLFHSFTCHHSIPVCSWAVLHKDMGYIWYIAHTSAREHWGTQMLLRC